MITRHSLLTALLLCALPTVGRAAPPPSTPTPEAIEAARNLRQQVEKMAPHNSEATMEFGALVEQGDDGVQPDRATALDLYEKAAAKGQHIARGKMCRAYLLGEGRSKDLTKAAPYCNSLGPEDPIALFWAAYDFQNGITGPKDEKQALDLYALSAANGSGDAALVLGRKAIADGKPEAARVWFRRGVKLGSTDAMIALADLLDEGKGGHRDSSEAT